MQSPAGPASPRAGGPAGGRAKRERGDDVGAPEPEGADTCQQYPGESPSGVLSYRSGRCGRSGWQSAAGSSADLQQLTDSCVASIASDQDELHGSAWSFGESNSPRAADAAARLSTSSPQSLSYGRGGRAGTPPASRSGPRSAGRGRRHSASAERQPRSPALRGLGASEDTPTELRKATSFPALAHLVLRDSEPAAAWRANSHGRDGSVGALPCETPTPTCEWWAVAAASGSSGGDSQTAACAARAAAAVAVAVAQQEARDSMAEPLAEAVSRPSFSFDTSNATTVSGDASIEDVFSGWPAAPADSEPGPSRGPAVPEAAPALASPWRLRPVVMLGTTAHRCDGSTDLVGAIEFEPVAGQHFVTGGICKRLRVYDMVAVREAVAGAADAARERAEGEDGDHSFGDDGWNDSDASGAVGRGAALFGARPEAIAQHRRGRSCSPALPSDRPGPVAADCSPIGEVACLRTPCKISAALWARSGHEVISGDYDGVLCRWDVATGRLLGEEHEHNSRRIWALASCADSPALMASGGEDGCAQLWRRGEPSPGARVAAPGLTAVCGLDFVSGSDRLLALACADACVHVFDIRAADRPLYTLRGHGRAVAYVRALPRNRLASAGVDGTVRLWQLPGGAEPGPPEAAAPCSASAAGGLSAAFGEASFGRGPGGHFGGAIGSLDWTSSPFLLQTFAGHANQTSFVGLAAAADGLLACGSEDETVALYDGRSGAQQQAPSGLAAGGARYGATAATRPLLLHPFGHAGRSCGVGFGAAGCHCTRDAGRFVSAVCWQPEAGAVGGDRLLLAASSEGAVQVLAAEHTPIVTRRGGA